MINCPFLNPQNENGFTIVEMIVVFSIIAILSSIGVAASINYSRAQALEAATQDLKTVLNQAKSYAQSQYKPSRCANQVLDKYRVDINEGENRNEYSLTVYCGSEQDEIARAKLPKDVVFDEDIPSEYFDFLIITGSTQSDGFTSPPWRIKLKGLDDRYKVITIDSNSSIK